MPPGVSTYMHIYGGISTYVRYLCMYATAGQLSDWGGSGAAEGGKRRERSGAMHPKADPAARLGIRELEIFQQLWAKPPPSLPPWRSELKEPTSDLSTTEARKVF